MRIDKLLDSNRIDNEERDNNHNNNVIIIVVITMIGKDGFIQLQRLLLCSFHRNIRADSKQDRIIGSLQ